MESHDATVKAIAASVRRFYDRKKPFRIYHGSTTCTRRILFERDEIINTIKLANILKIDVETRTALVEPNVSMDQLVEATLYLGLIPKVVMELPGITVGGGFSGTSGESSSFKHGLFEQTIDWVEIVLATGEIVTASATERPDLFYGSASAFGTLGVLTLLRVQLIRAEPIVELTYYHVGSAREATERITEVISDPIHDYVDAILFGPSSGVVMVGRLVSQHPDNLLVHRVSKSFNDWFYLQAKRIAMSSKDAVTVAIPVIDYLFRYDRGGFWMGRHAFRYFKIPFNRMTRWILDSLMHTRVLYHAMHTSKITNRYIVQDLALPTTKTQAFIDYIDRDFGIYPLWLCPIKDLHHGKPAFVSNASVRVGNSADIMINVGVWGRGPTTRAAFTLANRAIERTVYEMSGQKALYAQAFYTEQEFWEIYDRDWYNNLRVKYGATSLPSIFEKVSTEIDPVTQKHADAGSQTVRLINSVWGVWPLAGLCGLWKAILGGEYLLATARSREAEHKAEETKQS